MSKMKSLTERILKLKEEYLQPVNIIQKVKETAKNVALITITSAMLLGYTAPAIASEPINVKEYIQQNNYNLSSIFQLYLNPLNDNGLDENEKKAIDIIANAPEEKQEQIKSLAKEVYNNKGLTPEISAKLENLNLPSQEQEPVKGLEEKVTQKPENPVDIYAVIANGADDKTDNGKFFACSITSVLEFYKLMKGIGVSDDNITLFLYHPNTKDIINTKTKKWLDYYFGSTPLPHSKSEVRIDEEKVTLNKVLDAISDIPSDDNDLVYIMLSSHANPEYTIRFPNGRLSYHSLKKAIKKIDNYGKIFVILDSCHAGGFLEPLDDLKNYVGIGSCPKEEKCNPGIITFMLVKYKDKQIDELVKLANTEIENSKRNKATLIAFYSDKSFGNELLISKE